jgi:hypothetical protein
LDVFPNFQHLDNIAHSDYQPLPRPQLRTVTYPGAIALLTDCIAGPGEHYSQGFHETNLETNPYYPFEMSKEYKYIQCGIKTKGMKMYYDSVLQVETTAQRFPRFKNGDGRQKLVASMPADLAPGEWELHTVEDMKWNHNYQRPIKYWSRKINKSMRWLMQLPAYADHLIYTPQG